MKRAVLLGAVAAACTSSGGGPTRADFGLDVRPANACVAPAPPRRTSPVRAVDAFRGLGFDAPIYALQAPGDAARWFVLERAGKVRTFAAGDAAATTFAAVQADTFFEGGLLGMAFAPDWPTSRAFYLSYTAPSATAPAASGMRSVIARGTTATGAAADGPLTEVLAFDQPFANHNGGCIQFGPDGLLYAGFGDGGSGDDPFGNGQNRDTLFGKILRLDVRTAPYAIPPDNPFAGTSGARGEVWAYGLRNPWRFSFDRASGDLWVGDVGQNAWEEIDGPIVRGGNYGWNACEGRHARGSVSAPCGDGSIAPAAEHGRIEARAIVGGYVYRGAAIPALRGRYVYGDYETGNVWALTPGGAPELLLEPPDVPTQALVSFAEGSDGELYLVRIDGRISKLVAAPPPAPGPDPFPQTLSASGCVDPGDPTKPAPGLIPYDVISPLWSDGAAKSRWMAIPDGATVTIAPDGDFEFPNGTVLMKLFRLGDRRVETRLLMRHDDGSWAGYSYAWNDAQTEATLLPSAKTIAVGDQVWSYPSRSQCLQCHTSAAGGALGPEVAQLDRDFEYASTDRIAPELATLAHIGVLASPPPAGAAAMPDPQGTAPIEDRARAYLHANCAHCHRPGGGGQGTMDLRFGVPLRDTMTCNAAPTQGGVGPPDAKLIVPGSPEKSIVSLRMHEQTSKLMPPIAVRTPDPAGLELVDAWIRSLSGCP